MGRGRPGGEQQDRGAQENGSARWLTASGFIGMGLVSRLSLASHLARPTSVGLRVLPVARTPLSQDGFQREGFWEVGGLLPLTGPSQALPVSFRGSTRFLIGATCCDSTSGQQLVSFRPRWAVSVNGAGWTVSLMMEPVHGLAHGLGQVLELSKPQPTPLHPGRLSPASQGGCDV